MIKHLAVVLLYAFVIWFLVAILLLTGMPFAYV